MTTIQNELAKRQPANVPVQHQTTPARNVIDGEVVARPLHLCRLAGWFALLLVAALFAGFLLSMLQQHA